VLAFLSADPLAGQTEPVPLPEAVTAAEALELLTPAQRAEVGRWRTAASAWQARLANDWAAFSKSPRTAATRAKLLDTIGAGPTPLLPETFLTEAQRTELRRHGHALEGRILVEDLPSDAYRLRVVAVPLDLLVVEWTSGLNGLGG
jgi:hypothetical protein